MPSVLPLDEKPGTYFEHSRQDLVALLPRPLGATLDVGCGAGAVGRELRAAGSDPLVGVEMSEEAAERARSVYDAVIERDALSALEPLADLGPFDTICCYDILEHLYDPGRFLAGLRLLARPGGCLHVSIPNARHASLFRDLYLRGTFGYQTEGHRDATHLRWFTRSDTVRLLEEAGWTVEQVVPRRAGHTYQRWLTALSRGRLSEYFAVQWFVLGTA